MRMFARPAFAAVMLASLAWPASAADIRLLGIEAVAAAVRPLAADFARQTGHQVLLSFASPEVMTQKLAANEIHDVVILPEPAMDRLDSDGIVNPESRLRLAVADATTYEGALMSEGGVPQAATAFIEFLASPDARPAWAAAKFEPLPDH
jgi:ABC-type molybdate transport system substrate-binding protein